jgi:regulator of replication initiation timing
MEVEVQANYFDPSAGEMDILQYFATDDFDASPGAVIVESSHSSPNSGVFNSDEHDSDSESGLQNFNTYMAEQLPEQGTILATQTLQGIQSGPFYDMHTASPQSVSSSPEMEPAEKKKRGRKRRRTDEGSVDVSGDEEDVAFVALSREELLEISSRELEERTKKLMAIRPLTSAEQREIKRQRRLIKNREYAQASRAKKKGNMSEINYRMQSLEDENEELKRQVALLQARCNDLSTENNDLKVKLTSQSVPSTVATTEEQIDIFAPSEESSSSSFVNTLFSNITGFINLEPKKSFSTATNNTATALKAGVCLFMIFLSFGIFFQVGTGMFGKMPFSTSENFADEFRFRTFGSRTLKESSDAPAVDIDFGNGLHLKDVSTQVDHGPLTMDDVLMDEAVSFTSSVQVNNTNAQLPRQSNF